MSASLQILKDKTIAKQAALLPAGLFVIDRESGTPLPKPPVLILGTCTAAENTGHFIAVKSDGTFQKADPTDPTKMNAVAVIWVKLTDTTFAAYPLSEQAEVALAGAVAGKTYVVGTDARIAAEGDANYPTSGLKQVVGYGVDTDLVRIEPGYNGKSNALIAINADNALDLSNSNAETTLESEVLPQNYLQPGGIYRVRSSVKHAAGVSAHTFLATLKLGGTALFTGAAQNVSDTGDQTVSWVEFVVRSVGATGKILVIGGGSLNSGGSGGAPASDQQTLDTTSALTLAVTGTFSAAGATDHAKSQHLSIQRVG
jgi:hypothetical protein